MIDMRFTWHKKCKILDAKDLGLEWANTSILTPTPIQFNESTIRVYAGFRDGAGISRIGYIDLDYNDPTKIKNISQNPVLDIGKNGCFDDNGVILGDVIRVNENFYMYFVGFQIVAKAKFLAFSGLAISKDGESYVRFQDTPILDRRENATMINAIHSVINEGKYFRIWNAEGDGWQLINGLPYPKYNIWTSTSDDGILINDDSKLCVDCDGEEYRIGRPSVYKVHNKYVMFYTKGSKSGKDYFPGVAISSDGLNWIRQDNLFGLELSNDGWDSKHIAYPRLIQKSDNLFYVLYNGNDMGNGGLGYAELLIEE